MKKLLAGFFTVILCFHCGEPTTTSSTIQITPATAQDYQQLADNEKKSSPIGRLCAESKGYNIDEWLGLNECSWAVEKYHLKQHPNQASRHDSLLTLQLDNQTMMLVHQLEEPSTYYQFIDYLTDSKYFVIKVFQESSCPLYWLINRATGRKTELHGRPVFTAEKDRFLLTTSTPSSANSCPNKLAYWSLQDQVFQPVAEIPADPGITQLLWKSQTTWLGKQGNKVVEVKW